jgi:hypothetical protein
MKEVTDRLGLSYGGPTNRVLRRHADRLALALPCRPNGRRYR